MNARYLAIGLVGSFGCLDAPSLKTCLEFPLGTEGCETGCNLYCQEMVARCPSVYATEGVCLNDCANEPVTNFVLGDFGDTTGNSLSCRISFLREGNCTEASLRDTTQCIGARCEDYCALMMTNCEDAYPSMQTCEEACAVPSNVASGTPSKRAPRIRPHATRRIYREAASAGMCVNPTAIWSCRTAPVKIRSTPTRPNAGRSAAG